MMRHARIHLVNFADLRVDDEDSESPPSNEYLEAKYSGIISSMLRGDIIEDISISGYRSDGIWFWDGTSVIERDQTDDPYGMVPPVFKLGEFPPGYWNDLEDAKPFSVCWEDGESAFYWHINPAPVEFDVSAYCPVMVMAGNDITITVQVLGVDYRLVIYSAHVFNEEQSMNGCVRVCWNADENRLEYGFDM